MISNTVLGKTGLTKPETRDGMLKTKPKGKYDVNMNVHNVMDVKNAAAPIEDLKMYNDNYYQYSTSKGGRF
jgi:hypothetical protein